MWRESSRLTLGRLNEFFDMLRQFGEETVGLGCFGHTFAMARCFRVFVVRQITRLRLRGLRATFRETKSRTEGP
jgi:hypothetical protein